MNPSGNNSGPELPPITSQDIPELGIPINKDAEMQLTNKEIAPQQSVQQPQQTIPPISIAPPPKFVTTNKTLQDSNTTASSATVNIQIAKDKDLIDKEWVNKAKSIVEKNKDDPHKQSEELTLLKADYMKKQFNKTLKISQ